MRSRDVIAWNEKKSILQWSLDSRCKTSHATIWRRLNKGWKSEDAISAPKQNRKDLIGQRFGRLVVKESISLDQRGNQIVKCLCDCGNFKELTVHRLTQKNTESCGCLKTEINRQKGYKMGKAQTQNDIETFFKTIYGYFQRVAKKRKLQWELSFDVFIDLIFKNCFYCNRPPANESFTKRSKVFAGTMYNGIDRQNNKEGYTKTNSVTCCKYCNIAKQDLSLEDFLDMVKRIYEKQFIEINQSSIAVDDKEKSS